MRTEKYTVPKYVLSGTTTKKKYYTDDGKEFTNKKLALKHEQELINAKYLVDVLKLSDLEQEDETKYYIFYLPEKSEYNINLLKKRLSWDLSAGYCRIGWNICTIEYGDNRDGINIWAAEEFIQYNNKKIDELNSLNNHILNLGKQ